MKPLILSEYPLDRQDRYFRGLTDGVQCCALKCVQREESETDYSFTKEYYRQIFEEFLSPFSFDDDEVFKLSYFYIPLTQNWFQHIEVNGLADLKKISEKYRRVYQNELQYVYVDRWNEKNLRNQKNVREELNKLINNFGHREIRAFDLLTVTTYLKLPAVLIKEDTFYDNSLVI